MTGLQAQVRVYATEHGVTVDSIARAVGITRMSLNNKCSGKTEFRLGEAIRLSRILGIDVESLAGMIPCKK